MHKEIKKYFIFKKSWTFLCGLASCHLACLPCHSKSALSCTAFRTKRLHLLIAGIEFGKPKVGQFNLECTSEKICIVRSDSASSQTKRRKRLWSLWIDEMYQLEKVHKYKHPLLVPLQWTNLGLASDILQSHEIQSQSVGHPFIQWRIMLCRGIYFFNI